MKSGESTKSVLLDAFIELIADVGAHQVTLQKVAKKAKVPFSSAHYYYGGDWNLIFKDAVMKTGTRAQEYIGAYIQKNAKPSSNPVELYAVGTFQWIQECASDSRLWLFNYYFSSLHPEFAQQQKQFVKVGRERVLQLLYEAKGRGIYPEIEVSQDLADAVHTIIFGLGVMAMIQNFDAKSVNLLKGQAMKQIHSVLRFSDK